MFDLSRLNLCFIAGTLGQGGAERQLFYIIKTLKENRARVRLLCLTQKEFWERRVEELGAEVIWIGKSASRAKRLARIIQMLRKDPPQILQSQHFYTNLYAAFAARALGVREIGAMRNDCTSEVLATGAIMGRLSMRVPRFIAANSRAAIKNAVALGRQADHIHLLLNVVDTEQFKPSERITNGPVRLLSAGRLSTQKRMDRFLSILARVKKQSQSRVQAVIAGDGPLRGQLEDRALELGLLSDDVEFIGAAPDMSPVYNATDIFVLTSDWEGTPNVALEAMASGLPVVSTGVGGLPEIIRHGETGYLSDVRNEALMSNYLLQLINNPDLRKEMGRSAREYVLANHSPLGLTGRLANLYEAALS